MPETTLEAPVEPKTEIVNPVLPPDYQESAKSIFREEMDKANAQAPEETPEATEVAPTPQNPATEAPSPKEEPSERASKVPEELITGEVKEAEIDDAIAQIDAMVLPKNAKPEQVASFSKLKEAGKKAIQEKLDRIAELESKQTNGASTAELEAAKKRAQQIEEEKRQLEQTLERVAFTESPKFKQFLAEETNSLQGAKAYFEGTEINPEVIEVAARTQGQKRIQVLKDAGAESDQIAAVAPYLAQYDTIQRNKAVALENWKTDYEKWNQEQKTQQENQVAQRKHEEERVWSSVISKARSEIVPFRKFDKNDDWNSRGDQLETLAKQAFNGEGIGLEKMAEIVAKGVAYDALEEVRLDLTEQLKLEKQKVAKLTAAKPDGGSSQTIQGGKPIEQLPDDERRKATFNQELQKART